MAPSPHSFAQHQFSFQSEWHGLTVTSPSIPGGPNPGVVEARTQLFSPNSGHHGLCSAFSDITPRDRRDFPEHVKVPALRVAIPCEDTAHCNWEGKNVSLGD